MAEKSEQPAAELGRAIQLRRVDLGMKRRELAERAELSYPYVSELENGQKEPSAKALRQIAEALGLSSSELTALADRVGDAGSSGLLAEGEARADVPTPQPDPPPPLLYSMTQPMTPQSDAPLERRIRELVESQVRAELARWAQTELPAMVRAAIEAAERQSEDR